MLTYTTQQVVLEKPLSFRVHKIAKRRVIETQIFHHEKI